MSDQLSSQQEREYVERAWEHVEARWLPSIPDRFRVEMRYDSDMVWAEITGCGLPKTDAELTEQRAWHAAFLYTKEHERKIAEVRREIRFIGSFSCVANCREDEEARQRIEAARQSRLAELMRGWKGEA